MQLSFSLNLISRAISLNGLIYNPFVQPRARCPPDQLPPHNLTLLPVASTILIY